MNRKEFNRLIRERSSKDIWLTKLLIDSGIYKFMSTNPQLVSETAQAFLDAINSLRPLGIPGFAVLLEKATDQELIELKKAAQLILFHTNRVKSGG